MLKKTFLLFAFILPLMAFATPNWFESRVLDEEYDRAHFYIGYGRGESKQVASNRAREEISLSIFSRGKIFFEFETM